MKTPQQKLESQMDKKFKALQRLKMPYGVQWLTHFHELLDWYEIELEKIVRPRCPWCISFEQSGKHYWNCPNAKTHGQVVNPTI